MQTETIDHAMLAAWIDAAEKAGACQERLQAWRDVLDGGEWPTLARVSDDAAWVLIHAPKVFDRAALEACVTVSYDAAWVLTDAPEVIDRAALEARVTRSCDARWVLAHAPEVADRAALEALVEG